MTVQNAVGAAFAQFGSDLTVTTAGAGRTVRAILSPMDNASAAIYFDANEQVGLFKPSVLLYVAGTEPHPPLVDDTFTDADFPGPSRTTITVLKVQAFRVAGVVALYLALCD